MITAECRSSIWKSDFRLMGRRPGKPRRSFVPVFEGEDPARKHKWLDEASSRLCIAPALGIFTARMVSLASLRPSRPGLAACDAGWPWQGRGTGPGQDPECDRQRCARPATWPWNPSSSCPNLPWPKSREAASASGRGRRLCRPARPLPLSQN